MRHHPPALIGIAMLVVLLMSALAGRSSGQCPANGSGTWTVGVGQEAAGPLGTVNALLSWDPDGAGPGGQVLVAGGNFRIAGRVAASNIAVWDGAQWGTLGAGFDGSVNALAIYNGELIAAGDFFLSGAVSCNRIARWNGTSWQPLGSGLGGTASVLHVYNGRLYVGGTFTTAGGVFANRIASWDGSIWRTLGTGGANGGGGVERASSDTIGFTPRVQAMTTFRGSLYVGGTFSLVNGTTGFNALASWNGTAWVTTAVVANSHTEFIPLPEVRALAAHASQITGDSTLYVGGDFTSIGGVAANNIAAYPAGILSQGPWTSLGPGTGGSIGGPVSDILLQTSFFSVSGVLVTSTKRPFATNVWTDGTYRFASGAWNLYSPEVAASLGFFDVFVVGGVRGVSKYEANRWVPFGMGLDASPTQLVSAPNGLAAFGAFTFADGQAVNGAAILDATGWHPIGAGIGVGASPITFVTDAVRFGNEYFVTGLGTDSATGNSVYRSLRFNGTSWVAGGAPVSSSSSNLFSIVNAELYLCSDRVYRWNGAFWVSVGGVIPNSRPSRLVQWNGSLYASADQALYRLNGTVWESAFPYPSGYYSPGGLAVLNNRLFLSANIIMGSSATFELVGNAFVVSLPDFLLGELKVLNGQIIGSGGSVLLAFDGTEWSPFATTVSTTDLEIHGGSLYVAGVSVINSTLVAPLFGKLSCCPADYNGSGGLTVQDIFDFLTDWFVGLPRADYNGSGAITVQDVFDFLEDWFVGC